MINDFQCEECVYIAADRYHTDDNVPILLCPLCGSNKFVKLIGTGHFDLKGEGFYDKGWN